MKIFANCSNHLNGLKMICIFFSWAHLLNSHLKVYVLRKWPKNSNIKLLASNPYEISFLSLITLFPTSCIKGQKSQYILFKG